MPTRSDADLSPLEHALVDAVSRDEPLVVAEQCPGEVIDPAGIVRARVVRDILLGRLCPQPGPRGVRMRGVVLSGQLDLAAVRSDVALNLVHCRLPQPVLLVDARLPQLVLTGAHLAGVEADRLHVDSNLMFAGATVTGVGSACAVRLLGAVVGGQVSFTDAALRAAGNSALHADGLTVGGDLLLRGVQRGFTAHGAGDRGVVRLIGARIGGNVDCDRATVAAAGGPALTVERAEIGGNLYLRDVRLAGRAPGAVVLVGARVSGQCSCTGARIDCAGGTAVMGDDFQASGDVFLGDGFRAYSTGGHPGVRLLGARIGGHLDCADGAFAVEDAGDVALDLRFASIGKLLRLGARPAGWDGEVGVDPEPGSAGLVALDGLSYPTPPEGMDCTEWIDTLGTGTPSFAAQPYQQLAAAYRSAGREHDARRVLIAQQRDLSRRGDLTGWSRVWHRALGHLLGYGYQSWRSLLWLVATVATAIVLVLGLARWDSPAVVVAGDPAAGVGPARCATVDQVAVGIDLSLPLVDTGTRCALVAPRTADELFVAIGWVFQLLGWAFTTLFVAGYTGLIRRV